MPQMKKKMKPSYGFFSVQFTKATDAVIVSITSNVCSLLSNLYMSDVLIKIT